MDERHRPDLVLAVLKALNRCGVAHIAPVHRQQTRDHLHVVLDPVMHLAKQQLLLADGGTKPLFDELAVAQVLGHADVPYAVARSELRRREGDGHLAAVCPDERAFFAARRIVSTPGTDL